MCLNCLCLSLYVSFVFLFVCFSFISVVVIEKVFLPFSVSLSESQQTDPDSETRGQTFNKLQGTAKSTEDEKDDNKLMIVNHRFQ